MSVSGICYEIEKITVCDGAACNLVNALPFAKYFGGIITVENQMGV